MALAPNVPQKEEAQLLTQDEGPIASRLRSRSKVGAAHNSETGHAGGTDGNHQSGNEQSHAKTKASQPHSETKASSSSSKNSKKLESKKVKSSAPNIHSVGPVHHIRSTKGFDKRTGWNCVLCEKDLACLPVEEELEHSLLPETAVLPCGHVFHSLCLSAELSDSDPPCPICFSLF